MQGILTWRITGFVLSLILTFATYFIVLYPDSFYLKARQAAIVIFILALFQLTVQLIFFLNLWREKGPLWNLGFFLSTVFLIFTIIFFSIWIMDNLNYNMMPSLSRFAK
ncbi:cytochrome o ubiquinol oxidase subunit IV [Candidatus Protochlamydia phocaeensis]|uniref:cytochrome o ubiquinol oxidase subunit IV n=1 Tax=Candidatus Protochlamydia phocaeensis TaxID=1414722 RepID=UPI00083808E3|nr:cytochrome C oxidase subunit IV family protein [Candidatus Protochlamydia phocaeensis]